jgi:predicted nucleic acid-binding protein
MRKVFLDANVLVAVINKEYPLFRSASRVLSLADYPFFELYTSTTCLAIAFYFAEKKSGQELAKEKIKNLALHIRIANSGEMEVQSTLSNKKITDFEDGLQYFTALNAGCDVIITEDGDDFHFADIPIMPCEAYLREIALPLLKTNKQ